ncbi:MULTISPECIES: hypothetical protein [unclassified Aureimonas]|uniref:hypothetical protein n=1 Tax=unclassified Aureimonas TaxID=2615206 RepID=UPI000AC4B6B1|nr:MULTISPECIES: hypothetical protein [unclassified Aureimonas]
MKKAMLLALSLFVVARVHSAQAHSPYYTAVDTISVDGRESVSLKLLNGDGIFFADPMRAVVIDQHGTLLAASPLSVALTLLCRSVGHQRTCVVYDELPRMIYETKPSLWRNVGVIEEDGRPIEYPEYEMEERGFIQRKATIAETASAEFAGAIQRWPSTAIAIVWWTTFWLLILPVLGRLFGRGRRLGPVSVMLRLFVGTLMMPVTAHLWLLAPYSKSYFVVVSMTGALLAWLMTNRRKLLLYKIAFNR